MILSVRIADDVEVARAALEHHVAAVAADARPNAILVRPSARDAEADEARRRTAGIVVHAVAVGVAIVQVDLRRSVLLDAGGERGRGRDERDVAAVGADRGRVRIGIALRAIGRDADSDGAIRVEIADEDVPVTVAAAGDEVRRAGGECHMTAVGADRRPLADAIRIAAVGRDADACGDAGHAIAQEHIVQPVVVVRHEIPRARAEDDAPAVTADRMDVAVARAAGDPTPDRRCDVIDQATERRQRGRRRLRHDDPRGSTAREREQCGGCRRAHNSGPVV